MPGEAAELRDRKKASGGVDDMTRSRAQEHDDRKRLTVISAKSETARMFHAEYAITLDQKHDSVPEPESCLQSSTRLVDASSSLHDISQHSIQPHGVREQPPTSARADRVALGDLWPGAIRRQLRLPNPRGDAAERAHEARALHPLRPWRDVLGAGRPPPGELPLLPVYLRHARRVPRVDRARGPARPVQPDVRRHRQDAPGRGAPRVGRQLCGGHRDVPHRAEEPRHGDRARARVSRLPRDAHREGHGRAAPSLPARAARRGAAWDRVQTCGVVRAPAKHAVDASRGEDGVQKGGGAQLVVGCSGYTEGGGEAGADRRRTFRKGGARLGRAVVLLGRVGERGKRTRRSILGIVNRTSFDVDALPKFQ